MFTDHAAQARSYSATAAAATRRAARQARMAEQMYSAEQNKLRHARWLTSRPGLWDGASFTPARYEADALSFRRMGDMYVKSSFRATDSATFYREMAAKYRDMAARQAARLAETTESRTS